MAKKFKLTSMIVEYKGKTLYRIQALHDFSDVKKGELGGFVEHEKNLSHEGDCWIYEDSVVMGLSKIEGRSVVSGRSIVDNSIISGSSVITDNSFLSRSTVDDSIVKYRSDVDASTIENKSTVYFSTIDRSIVKSSIIKRSAIRNHPTPGGSVIRFESAKIESASDYITITNIGSRLATLTAYRCVSGEIKINTGCFSGCIDEFLRAVEATHRHNKYAKQYLKAVELIKLTMGNKRI